MMRPCKQHWQMYREAIEARGLSGLIDKSGKAAVDTLVKELQGAADPVKDFDPLMSMYWHFMNGALANGGLYLMAVDASVNPDNDGHYCPTCEYIKHVADYDAQTDINNVADQIAQWCREQGLISAVQ